MYLSSFELTNVKCFGKARFVFPHRQEDGRCAGWHVILGANASGKTTALQAMAVCLLGPMGWMGMVSPTGWFRGTSGEKFGELRARLIKGDKDVADRYQKGPFDSLVYVTPEDAVRIEGQDYDAPQFALSSAKKKDLLKSVYASKKSGWFACGYGPFRRLSGGNAEVLTALRHPRQPRFASLFHESVALTQCEPWLRDLHHQANDPDNPEREAANATLAIVKSIINFLLPGGVKLQQITSAGVRFTTMGGSMVLLSDLSDGYRSFLALAIDIVRHVTEVFGERISELTEHTEGDEDGPRRVLIEGVVLIDEIDAHLHPSWQRRIGTMLQHAFPNIQFIVSTHSPFIAQAASEGGLFVLRPSSDGDAVKVVQPIPSVRGWRADAILTSELFGMKDTVDPETEEMLQEYHELSTKRSFHGLSAGDQEKLDALEVRLSNHLTSPGETLEEMRRRRETDDYIDRTLRKIRTSEEKAETA